MPVDVIVGLQWGDEGKGKIVDLLAPNYNIIARFQGGPNAGHTLVINDKKFVFHTLPSGVIHSDITNLLGSGMVIDPVILRDEIEELKLENIHSEEKIIISGNAHLILPTHRLLDLYYEKHAGLKKIGSTLKGIGPCYQDKYGRRGLKISEIKAPDFLVKYCELKNFHIKTIDNLERDKLSFEEDKWFDAIDYLKELRIMDTEVFVHNEIEKGSNILAEGAQGTFLDVNFGTYPYITSSHTISGSACTGLGVSPKAIRDIYGIFKAYATRVGEGPFLTEQDNVTGKKLMERGSEYGATTGRPRRCGWLDLVALKYSCNLNGVNKLVITKTDVLDSIDSIKLCDSYTDASGKQVHIGDIHSGEIAVIPNYREFRSWNKDLSLIKMYDQLPVECQDYLEFIEKYLNLKISILSLGPERSQTIIK
jgi:adenylosuccinate synthase